MKTIRKITKTEVWLTALVMTMNLLFGAGAFAQNSAPEQVDVNINTNSGGAGWYAQPWVWVVGVALFIIIIIAITRSGNSREV
ncbi:hypothetical protein [Desertivirga xinjiangensis]|uniref:hypothetical protein n=1 Tax=Desertivirga xinjiangensis TaxID=539206 RepID=UPI00210ACB82|nr:hypothetical protein [Pedobacter xinjiangensis]